MLKIVAISGAIILMAAPFGARSLAAQETTPPLLEGAPIEMGEANETETNVQPAITYTFDECVRPEEPVLAIDKKSRGRVTRAAENQAVRQYNAHVEESNAYMRCIADQAQRDLDAYYKAVSEALDGEQARVMGGLSTMRDKVQARR